jgi:hypothetical protein
MTPPSPEPVPNGPTGPLASARVSDGCEPRSVSSAEPGCEPRSVSPTAKSEPRSVSPTDAPGWRAHAAALFVSFHIVCVFICALPSPPVSVDEEILKDPEVKAELDASFGTLHSWVGWRDTPEEIRDDVFAVVRAYTRGLDWARAWTTPYLEATGSLQGWHMFGGTPPRSPLVFVVRVQPEGEKEMVLFQDLRWGTADSAAMNFRHRKAHEILYVYCGPGEWSAYAAFWARLWDRKHPDRPARRVELTYLRMHTPAPEDIRGGDPDRHPEVVPATLGGRVQLPFVWERP